VLIVGAADQVKEAADAGPTPITVLVADDLPHAVPGALPGWPRRA
jgi:hypothetical protein